MTNKLSFLAASLTLLLFGCAKNQSKNLPATDPVSQAEAFFGENVAGAGKTSNKANYRANQLRTIQWSAATVQPYSGGDAVIVPISYRHNLFISHKADPGHVYPLSDLTSLVISRDSTDHWQSAVITFIPDSANSQASPRGTYIVEDWQGNTIYSPIHSGAPSNQPSPAAASSTKEVDYTQSIQVCDDIEGYNYSPDDPSGGVAWSETTCTTYEFPAANPQAGMPPARLLSLPIPRYVPPLEVIVAPPTSAISSIADYFKCFTLGSSPGQTYTVQVCVDQPDPGTRQPWTWAPGGVTGTSAASNPLNVGHTFLVLTENSQGNIITRNIGFYPASPIFPVDGYTAAQGILNNDDGHQYNISLTIIVSANQFFGILNYLSLGDNPGFDYDLNSDNCTTFAINALGTNGITLPSTKGSWPTGSGNDPGDLGEDISQMQLDPNMTRNTGSNPHPNVGTCN